MIKHLILFLLSGISFSLFAQSTWQQTTGPEGCYLFDLERTATTIFAATTNGLWQSTDEGATWTPNNTLMLDQSVDALSITNDEILVVSVEFMPEYKTIFHLYRSTDGGVSWENRALADNITWAMSEDELDVWRDGALIWITDRYKNCFKSPDNGETWSQVYFPDDIYPLHLAMQGDTIIAFDYYSIARSEDGGLTWNQTPDTISYHDLYFEGDFIMYNDGNQVSVSQDFGNTWQTAPFNFYYLGDVKRGTDGDLYRFYGNVFRSSDGLTWTPLTQLSGNINFSHGVQSGTNFVVAGSNIYKTTNNSPVLSSSQSGMFSTSCTSIAANSAGRVIVSTFFNGGTWSTNNKGVTWNKLGNPGSFLNTETSFNTMTAQGDTIWGVCNNDTLYRIIGNGNTWEKIIKCDAWFDGGTFVRVLDNVVYLVERDQIRRSFDQGATWGVLLTNNSNSDYFRGIAKVGNYLFYSTNGGLVFRSADNGLTWQNIYEIWSPGAYNLNALTTHDDVLYLWNEHKGFYTVDFGVTWIEMGFNGLPVDDTLGQPYFEATDVQHFNNAIVATIPYNGVWITFDMGNNWVPLNDGLTNKRGRYLAISGNDIFFASSTSGVWRLGTNFEVFSGNVYNDLNNNGQKDAGEGPLASRIVGAEPLGSYTTSTNAGVYSLIAAAQLDTIRMQPPNNYCTVSPPFHAAAQPGGNYDFGVHFTEDIVDLRVDLANWEPFRPGFDNKITLTVQNIGNETVQNAQVIAILPAALSIDYITPAGLATVSNDTIFWTIAAIAPFASASIQLEVTLSANEPLGSFLSTYAHVDAPDDVDQSNNQFWLREVVVGSYDPNDKYAISGITPQDVLDGKPIEYLIRFENIGTFYAEKVVITDVLDKNLNPATFQFISSSHPCQWRIATDGKLEFTFNDIFLLSNETGFVKFSIEADRNLQLNDVVSNTANIYFDFNAPIITNTVETTVKINVATHAPQPSGIYIELAPNPAQDVLYATVTGEMVNKGHTWELTDATGKVLLREQQRSETTRFSIAALPNGTYEVVLRNRNAVVVGVKTVVVVR